MTKRINLKSNLDGRIGLGYGTIRPIFDEPRMSSSTWPYSSIQQEEMPPMFAPDEEVEFDGGDVEPLSTEAPTGQNGFETQGVSIPTSLTKNS